MENKNTTIIAAVLGIAIITLMFSFTHNLKTPNGTKAFDEVLTVTMPRPVKDMILGFTLEGRSIIRQIEAFVTGIPAIAKKADPKAAANGTKAIADKGAKKTTTTEFAAARARAQYNEQRRQAFNARVVEQADRYRESLRLKAEAQAVAYAQAEAEIVWRKQEQARNDSNPKADEEDRMTSAEWKSLILAQPTEANVAKMIKAIHTGGIDTQTYLEISEALVKDNSQDKKKLGVDALVSIYRQEAFVLAAHLEVAADTDATTKKRLTDYMYSYNSTQRLGVFDAVLKSSDTIAAEAAAKSISSSVQVIQQQQQNRNNPRTGSGTVQQMTMNSYKRLLPTLQYVASKNLHNLKTWAQTLISQLQTLSTTA